MNDTRRFIAQAAAIPYRLDARGGVEVLLIRRKDEQKWGIPKGMVDPGLSDAEAAAMEAREEAGIEGELSPAPLGTFTYEKLGRSLLVQVFSMRVTKIHDTWLEQSFRRREWFPVDEATDLVSREGVRRLIRKFAEEMGRTGEGRRVGGVE